ncbi:MAG: PAS domain-containing protein, partial [Lachnospiraceae bacterium]|nr:PAS domain-containing protein [Lachnospiraceae bacterium]
MRDETGQLGNQAQSVGGAVLPNTEETIWKQEPYMEQLQNMMDDFPGGICVLRWVDGHLKPLAMSKEFSRILQVEGDPKQDIYSMKQILYIHPEDQIRLDQYILECIQHNSYANITIRFQYDQEKEYRWINIRGKIVDQDDGTKLCYVSCNDVTRERDLASQIKSSDVQFQTAMENCHIYSGRYDVRKGITYFNRRMQEDFGLPEQLGPDEVLPFHLVTEENRQNLRDLFQDMCTDKRDVMTIEMPMRNIHGEQVWVRQIYTVVEKDESQNPLTIISTALDITEHRRDEQRLYADDVYHQVMNKDTFSVICINVTQWKVLNGIGESMESVCDSGGFLLSLQDTIPDAEMRSAFQKNFNRQNMLRVMDSGENKLSYAFRSRRANGGVIWMEITADMIQQENGEVLALVQIKDINHQVIVDQVRNSLIDRFVDFVAYYILADGSSYILSENKEYCFRSDEESGALQKLSKYIADKVSPEEWKSIQRHLNIRAIEEHLDYSSNYQYTFQIEENGIRNKRVNYYYLDQNKDVIVISQQDITDLVREEVRQKEELQRALDIATHASHTREEFLSNMSHDLRTPLNGIIGASELAKTMVVSHPYQATEYLNDIYSSGHFMLNLVNDILEMSQLEFGKQELENVKIEWSLFSKDLRQVFEPTCREKGLQMKIALSDMPVVLGDSFQLRRILHNLLSNAVKFTESGGTVECSVVESKMIRDTFLTTIKVQD